MGFFDRFTKSLSDWEFRWSDAGRSIAGAWDAGVDFTKENMALTGNLAMTAFGTGDAKKNAEAYWANKSFVDRAFGQANRGAGTVGSMFGAAAEMPALRQGFAFAESAQDELVRRPIATANLVIGDAVNERNLGAALDGESWREAYNTTTYVTPGQALVFALMSEGQLGSDAVLGLFGQETDELDRKWMMENWGDLGIISQDPSQFDPRNRDSGRQAYYENNYMKGLSGTIDAGIVMFLDPTIVGGKMAAAAKMRYVSQEMTAAAIQSGRLEGYVDSRAYQRAKRFVEDAPSSETVRRRMLNNHYSGDLASALLFDATRLQKSYEASGGSVDLYDTTFRALYGDVKAWDTLAQEASPLADIIGHERANYTIANAAQRYGTGDPVVDARVSNLVEKKTQAWADATVAGHGMWGQLGKTTQAGGLLAGTTVPRLTVTSKWREGTYHLVRNKVPTTFGFWARRSRLFLPSQRSGRMLDLNDPNSVGLFRSWLNMSRFDQHELDRWVGAYARATSSEGRFNIYNAAENYVYAKHGESYGLSREGLNRLIPTMNRMRRGNRQILAANKRFASDDVAKAYERTLVRNRATAARTVAEVKREIEESVKRGDMPDAYYTLPDEMGNLTLVPQDLNLRLDRPVLNTQHADMVPLVDINVLENALWWHAGFGRGKLATKLGVKPTWAASVGKNIYSAQDFTRAGLEAILSVWKVGAILRPGYVPRTLSDEVGRVWAVQGAHTSLSTMGAGSRRTSANMWSRGRLLGDIITRKAARAHPAGGRIEVDAQVEATAPRQAAPPESVTTAPEAAAAPETPATPLMPEEVANVKQAVAGGMALDAAVGQHITRPLSPAERRVFEQGISEGLSAKRIRMNLEQAAREPRDPTRPQDTDMDFGSLQEAFAEGVIGVDDLLTQVELQGNAGSLSPQLTEIYDTYRASSKTDQDKRVFRRHAIDSVLLSQNRGTYTSSSWQRELLDEIEENHVLKKPGKPGKPLLIDPLTGSSPDLTPSQIENGVGIVKRHEIEAWEDRPARRARGGRVIPAGKIFATDDLYDFIADNMDLLMRPDHILHAFVTPAGKISLGVARNMNPKAGVKPTAGIRAKLPWSKREGDLLRDSGTQDVVLNTAAGRLSIRAAFTDDRFRKQVSSRGPEGAWVDAVTDINFARFVEKSQRFVDVGPDDWQTYSTSWERAVRLQLGQDKVAQQFLEGKSYNDVLEWMQNTNEGRAYHWKMGPWRSQFAEQVSMVQAMVETYVPFSEARRGESMILRQKVLDGTATVADLEAVTPRTEMPRVHGATLEMATGRGPIMDGIKKGTDKAFEYLSDKPNDKLVRYPFAAERYAAHAKTLAEARGVSLAKAGESFSVKDVEAIEQLARTRALRDVQRYLFHTNATWDLAKSMRLFVPFGSAIADSALKWGIVLRENPGALLNIWKLWNTPERAGLVQDQDGNELTVEDGEEIWYQVHPETGERTRLTDHKAKQRYISFRLPSWLSGDRYGDEVKPMVRINKQVFQTFLDVPTFGPMVSIPASKFSLDNPEFADNRFVKQWILPNGPTADSSTMLIPSNVRNIRQVVFPNWAKQDRQTAEAQTIAIFAADMTSYSLGQRPEAPTFEEAREKAAAMRGLRFWSAFGAGISPQIQSPYQPYVDYYRQLRVQEAELRRKAAQEGADAAEIPAADQLFYEEMGDEFFALTAAVTRNALGIPATIEADNAFKKYQDMIERHPDVATWIVGSEGAGEFSRAVYEAQKTREVRPGSGELQRTRLSAEQSWEDSQKRKGWIEYGKYQDLVRNDLSRLGLRSLEQTGAERVKAARDAWLEERMFVESPWGETVLNPWFQDFRSIDTSRMTARLHSFRQLVQDTRLQGRDDVRGLIEYLRQRDRFKTAMDRQGFASLSGDQAFQIRAQWQNVVTELTQSNLSFSAMYDRWLTADEFVEAR